VISPLDIAVIGGGITGLAVARLAARNGFRCAVLERSDLASGTSSASSHMLHGGLRYLEHGRFALIREALRERRIVGAMSPALATPQRFLVPLYRGDRVGPWQLRAGLLAYDWLAGPRSLSRHAVVRAGEALALEPGLEDKDLVGAGIYSDVVVDDARLAVAVARDAAAHGAEIRTYTDVLGARPAEGGSVELVATDTLAGEPVAIAARVVIVAAGPWTDEVRLRLARSLTPGRAGPVPLLRPSRGVHLVYPALTGGHGLVPIARADGRVFFVVPFGRHSLVGTTEVEVPAPPAPAAWRPTLEEIRYLRRELARVLPGTARTPPIALMSGLRPLLRSEEDEVGSASREHRVLEDHGVFVVTGGKYTTFRVMARDALACAVRRLRPGTVPIADPVEPLPPPLAPGTDLERIADFAVEHEFARRLADVIRRRSLLWLEPDRGRVAAPRIAAAMARRLGWSPERTREEIHGWEQSVWEEESLILQSQEET